MTESNKAATIKILGRWHHHSHECLQKPASTNFPICVTSRFGGHDIPNPSFLFLVLGLSLLHQRQSIRPTYLNYLAASEAVPSPSLVQRRGPKDNPCFKSGQAKLLDETKNGPHVAWTRQKRG